jgi:hypothetical protein
MRPQSIGLRASLLLLGSLLFPPMPSAQTSPTTSSAHPRFWQAAGAVAAINGLTWFYNWHIQRWPWANIGTDSWWTNLRRGFAWDDDAFGANQLAHPYHGNLYFNAARGSGYGFWGSTPFVVAGSLGWEFFTEKVRPSLNDLINTTLGGIALGEVAYRMSALLTSNRATAGRQMGAFLIDPISRTQSLIHGDNGPSLEAPTSNAAFIAVGRRSGTGASPVGLTNGRPFVGVKVEYGSAFDPQATHPYDAFEFSMHLSPNEHVVLTHAAVSGLLTRYPLRRSEHSQLLLGVYQNYDYDDLLLTKASSQSVSAAMLYRATAASSTLLDLGLHLELLPLAAISSDYDMIRRRDYNFGVGFGGRFSGALRHSGRELVRVDARSIWVHSLYGAQANHRVSTATVSATIPAFRMLRLGADVDLTLRQSSYLNQAPISRRQTQVRAYLVWSPS